MKAPPPTPPIASFTGSRVEALFGDSLREAQLEQIELATTRLWLSFFLVGLVADERRRSVRFLLDAIVRATRRETDVRLIIANFISGPEGFRANATAAGWLADRGVAVRVYGIAAATTGQPVSRRRSSHSKFLLRDEQTAIIGSANITPGGLDDNHELALLVESSDLVRDLAGRFVRGWAEATPWGQND